MYCDSYVPSGQIRFARKLVMNYFQRFPVLQRVYEFIDIAYTWAILKIESRDFLYQLLHILDSVHNDLFLNFLGDLTIVPSVQHI